MPCVPAFEDNQGAVQLAQNPVTTSNSKKIDVRHHFLRELVRQRDIKAALYTIVPRSPFLLFVLQNIAGYKNDIKCG